MFLSRNKNKNVYPCKPQFYYIKVGFKGVKLCRFVFMMYWTKSLWHYQASKYNARDISSQGRQTSLSPKVDFIYYINLSKYFLIINELAHRNSHNLAGAPSKDSAQSAHPRSPIRVFAGRIKILWVLSYEILAQRRL